METTRDISSSTLKLVAIICMTANHAGYIFHSTMPSWAFLACIVIGGATFPTMAFLITEGYRRTSNVYRYMMRLFVFALISQAPFWFFLSHCGNVLFTLLIGLILVHLDHTMDNRVLFACAVVAGCALSYFCDWPIIGPAAVLFFERLRDREHGIVTACWIIAACVIVPLVPSLLETGSSLYLAGAAGGVFGGIVTSLLLPRYQGRRGFSIKYFFYIYYPAHIAILGLIHLALIG